MMNNEEKAMTNKIGTGEFFERYKNNWRKELGSYKTKNEIDNIYEQVDLALYDLLLEFKDKLPPLDENFHAAFRKYESIGEGVDSAIWHLLNVSKLFWKTINSFYEEEKEDFKFGDKVLVRNKQTDKWEKAMYIEDTCIILRHCCITLKQKEIDYFEYCKKGWDEDD